MECVLLKMGVDAAEFTNPGGTGAIQLYLGNGSTIDKNTPAETTLVPTTADTTALDNYDQVIFPCWGVDPRATKSANLKTATQQANVIDYTTGGGRVFGTHFSYSWLYNDTPFSGTATWNDDIQYTSATANVPNPGPSEPDVSTFYSWINNVPQNAATNGTFTVISPRNDFSAINLSTSELWATATGHQGRSHELPAHLHVPDAGPAPRRHRVREGDLQRHARERVVGLGRRHHRPPLPDRMHGVPHEYAGEGARVLDLGPGGVPGPACRPELHSSHLHEPRLHMRPRRRRLWRDPRLRHL
jgi:hypothetical protein